VISETKHLLIDFTNNNRVFGLKNQSILNKVYKFGGMNLFLYYY
jgi:hypothetical protein